MFVPGFSTARCLSVIGLLFIFASCSKPIEPSAVAPVDLMESVADVSPEKVWIHPSARRLLVEAEIPVGKAAPLDDLAAKDPSVWREQNREHRYEAVVVAGTWSEIGPLAEHLRGSPDFYIDRVDPWGVVFRRGLPRPWQMPDVETIGSGDSPVTRATALSRTAMIYQVLGENRSAQRAIATAMELEPGDANVLARKATIDLLRGRFADAVSGADLVLKEAPRHVAALQIKAQALSKAGADEAAWEVAEDLILAADKNDMISLALHAQLANAARAYSREQESLEAVVVMSERVGIEPVMYRVLLGQCYAR
ncbi:MAG: tetratricopeptide repeat protein, partial [Chthoniobacterales bacterium]